MPVLEIPRAGLCPRVRACRLSVGSPTVELVGWARAPRRAVAHAGVLEGRETAICTSRVPVKMGDNYCQVVTSLARSAAHTALTLAKLPRTRKGTEL